MFDCEPENSGAGTKTEKTTILLLFSYIYYFLIFFHLKYTTLSSLISLLTLISHISLLSLSSHLLVQPLCMLSISVLPSLFHFSLKSMFSSKLFFSAQRDAAGDSPGEGVEL